MSVSISVFTDIRTSLKRKIITLCLTECDVCQLFDFARSYPVFHSLHSLTSICCCGLSVIVSAKKTRINRTRPSFLATRFNTFFI